MRLKSVLLLAVAVGCGLVAMLGVQQAMGNREEQPEEVVKVLVASADIMPGTKLDETNTSFRQWPKDAVPEGAVTKPEQIEERALLARAVPGEMIMLAKVGEKGVYGASAEIPEGMRVVTVQVNQTKTHSGLLRPGDRVDVMVTYKRRMEDRGMVTTTRTVLEYIRVFATDSLRASGSPDAGQEINAKNISVLVDPEQAAILMLAQNKGELTLALRRGDDSEATNSVAIDDSFLEDGETSHGADNPVDPTAEPVEETTRKTASQGDSGDVRSFLNQNAEPPAKTAEPTTTQVAAVTEPELPTWKIEIFAGDTRRVEEVELPEAEREKTDQKTTAAPKNETLPAQAVQLPVTPPTPENTGDNGLSLSDLQQFDDTDWDTAPAAETTTTTPAASESAATTASPLESAKSGIGSMFKTFFSGGAGRSTGAAEAHTD